MFGSQRAASCSIFTERWPWLSADMVCWQKKSKKQTFKTTLCYHLVQRGNIQMFWHKAWSSRKHFQLNLEGTWFTLPCFKAFSFFFPILYLNRWRAYLLGTRRQKHVCSKDIKKRKSRDERKERRTDFHTEWKQLMRIVNPKQWEAARRALLWGDLWTGF